MDVCESQKKQQRGAAAAVDSSSRRPLVPAERNSNASAAASPITPRRPQSREVASRYKSPSRPTPPASSPRRCPSPSPTRTLPSSPSRLVPKRAISAERKRPSTPPSPSTPSTPVHDSSVDLKLPPRRLSTGSRLHESLWPSTMRSLSVSFQSDTISVPISKKEKPASNVSSDRTLRPSSNVAHKPLETSLRSPKPAPERNKSPVRGKNTKDQSENARPSEGSHTKLIEQHRWPSRIGGKVSSNSLNRSLDLSDKSFRGLSSPTATRKSLPGRMPVFDGPIKPLQKAASEASRLSLSLDDIGGFDKSFRGLSSPSAIPKPSLGRISVLDSPIKPLQKTASEEIGGVVSKMKPADYKSLRVSVPQRHALAGFSDTVSSVTPAARSQSLPSPGSRSASPSRTPASRGISSPWTRPPTPLEARSQSLPSPGSRPASPSRTSASRLISPSRSRPSTPPSRLVSPSRVRPSTVATQSESSTSVLSFIADFKKGKKTANYIDDAHQLRLLYNRYLQWRFANAQADDVMYIQKVNVEKTLCNVWNATLDLRESVVRKRIILQQLNLELKLNAVLSDQMAYLDVWDYLEEDHINSLTGAVEDLEAGTLRLPVTGGAKVDIESLKLSIASAVDVMKAMGFSICSLLPRMESMNGLVTELAVLAARERAMLEHCEACLASTAAMQVEEYSIRSHLMQMEQAVEKQHISTPRPMP